MVPLPRIELETQPYHGYVIPFNYRGKKINYLLYKLEIFKLLPFFFIKKQAISYLRKCYGNSLRL